MDCSMPGFLVHHQFLEFAQTHVHWVGDAIQPSHPLSSPSSPPSIFPSIRALSSESVLRMRWPKYWSFSISLSNEYSRLISFRIDWFDWLIWPIGQNCPDLIMCIRNCLMNSWFSLWLLVLYVYQKSRQLNYFLLKNAIWMITNKVLLYSIGNSTQYFVAAYLGRESRMDLWICRTDSLCWTPETNTTL